MLNDFRQKYPMYADMPDDALYSALSRKGMLNANHDNLADGVNASTSHQLQSVAPEVKPVVKGTKAEVLAMKQRGQIAPGNVVHIGANGDAYIINAKAVQDIYGASTAQSLKMAKKDLEDGGEIESILLGYPVRGENNVTMAVDKSGEVLTDMGDIAKAAESNNVIWAAEGNGDDVQGLAERVARKWKTIGEDNEATEDAESGQDGQRGGGDEAGYAHDDERLPDAEGQGRNEDHEAGQVVNEGPESPALRPIVFHEGQRLVGNIGDRHDDVLQANGLPTDIQKRAFITPEGKTLNRREAVKWLAKNDPETYRKLGGIKALHTEDYNKAANV